MNLIRIFATFLAFLFLVSCSKEGSVPEVRLLGFPPNTAYLGVEYYYVMGVDGGSELINYSLTNNPEWLTIERPNSLIRPGVVLRGVPGVSGPALGELDIESSRDISITANDGVRSDTYKFPLEVKANKLQVGETKVTEGQSSSITEAEPVEGQTPDTCALPKMDEKELNVAGQYFHAYPILVPVTLANPSVLNTRVRYIIKTKYDGENGRVGINNGAAQLNKDVFVDYDPTGENAAFYNALKPSVDDPFVPGQVTIPAGATTCYIRVYVNDDVLAEFDEVFSVELTSVEEGLVELGAAANVTISDNEPKATLRMDDVSVFNEGSTHTFFVELDKAPGEVFDHFDDDGNPVFVPLSFNVSVKTILETDEDILGASLGQDSETDDLILSPNLGDLNTAVVTFTGDQKLASFTVTLPDNGDNEPGLDETFRLYIENPLGEVGARSDETTKTVRINEWLHPVDTAESYHQLRVDGNGNLYALSVRQESGKEIAYAQIFDRFGNPKGQLDLKEGPHVIPVEFNVFRVVNFDEDGENPDDDLFDDVIAVFNIESEQDGQPTSTTNIVKFRKFSTEDTYDKVWDKSLEIGAWNEATSASLFQAAAYIVGNSRGQIQFTDEDGEEKVLDDKGGTDIFILRYNLAGEEPVIRWLTKYGTAGEDVAKSVTLLGSNVAVIGETDQQAGFQAFGGVDGVLIKAAGSRGELLAVRQYGSSLDDVFDLVSSPANLVIAGTSAEKMRIGLEDPPVNEEEPEVYNNNKVQLGVYTQGFEFNQHRALGFTGDTRIDAGDKLNREMYYGGHTTGLFRESDRNLGGSDAFLFRLAIDNGKKTSSLVWSSQFGTQNDDAIKDVRIDGEVKLFYLARMGDRDQIGLYSIAGDRLTN